MINWLELDGAQGEGGGQILRTALTLSLITGQPFRINNIRAKRAKPGLLRQHLTAVQAATTIGQATVNGASIGSTQLAFQPHTIQGGDYQFAIGTAGSCTLVLQTVLPALWFAAHAGHLTVQGGTHNPMAPPADFLIRTWLSLMRRLGVQTDIQLQRHGFYPAGGGKICATTTPGSRLQPFDLQERGTLTGLRVEAKVAGLPIMVAQRELDYIQTHLTPGLRCQLQVCPPHELPSQQGPGNVVTVEVTHEHTSESFTAFGERGVLAESVAAQVVKQVRHYLDSSAAVSEHLADQWVMPLALAGGGSFTTTEPSSHLQTNLAIIERFLPIKAEITPVAKARYQVRLA